jgi:hypothetical protein
MKIALVGVPKTGKTKLAKKYKADGYIVLDNVPQKFSKRTGNMVGPYATWYVNAMLAGVRLTNEYELRDEDFVATTTLLDSLVYALWAAYRMEGLDPENITLDMINQSYYFTTLYMSRLVEEAWNYDKVIFLPYKGSDDALSEINELYLAVLDQKIGEFEYVKED